MSALGSLVVSLGLDFARFTGGLDQSEQSALAASKRIQDTMDDLKGRLATTAGAIAGGLAAAFTVSAFKEIISNSIETGAALDDLRMQTGATVEALSALVAVGKFNDMGPEAIGAAMNKLAANMSGATEESKGTGKALEALGLDFDKFKQMRPEDQMQAVAKAMAEFEDGAGKSAVAMALYGKQGAQMLPFLGDLADVGELQATVTTEQAAASASLDDNLQRLTTTGEGWKKELASGMIPKLNEGAKALVDVINEVGGLRAEIHALATDGTIASWTHNAITGLTYVMDVVQGLVGAVQIVGLSFEAVFLDVKEIASTAFMGMAALKNGKFGEAADIFGRGLNDMTVRSEKFKVSIDELWNPKLKGQQIREQMLHNMVSAMADLGSAAEETKPKLKYDNTLDDNAKAADKAKAAFDALLESVTKRTAAYQAEVTAGEKLTEGEKVAIDVLEQLRTGKVKLTEVQTVLLGKRLEEMLVAEDALELHKEGLKIAEAERAERVKRAQAMEQSVVSMDASNQSLREEIELIGLTERGQLDIIRARNEITIATKQATLAELQRQSAITGTMTREQIALEAEIELLKERNDLLGVKFERDEGAKAAEEQSAAWNDMWTSVDNTAHDVFVSVADEGMGAFERIGKTLKSAVLDMLYQMTIKQWIFSIAGMSGGSADGTAKAAGGASNVLGMANTASNAYSMYTAGINGSIGGSISSIGSMFGSNAAASFGAGMANSSSMAGAIAAYTEAAAAAELAGNAALASTYTATANGLGAGASSASVVPVVGWIMAAMAGNGMLYDKGYKWDNRYAGIDPVVGITDGIWQALGVSGKGAAILSGSALQQYLGDKIFGSKRKEVEDSGIEGTFDSSGFSGNRFQDWKKDGGWFKSDKRGKDTSALEDDVQSNFTDAFIGVKMSMTMLAESLGLGTAVITGYAKDISIALTADEEKNKQLIADTFGGMAEEMSKSLLGGAFAREGETSIQTLGRMVTSLNAVNGVFDLLGVTMLQASLVSGDAASGFIDLLGGLESFATVTSSYYENYYSEAERMANATEAVAAELAKTGQEMPSTKTAYRAMVTEAINAGEAGAGLAAKLLQLSPAFAQVADAAAAAAEAAAEMAAAVAKELSAVQAKFLSPAENAQTQYDSIAASLRGIGVGLDSANLAGELKNATLAAIGAIAQEIWPTLQTDEARLALIRATDAIADMKRGADALGSGRFDAVDGAYAALQKSVNLRRGIVQETIKATRAVFDTVRDNVKSLYSEVDSAAAMQAAQGRAFIEQALAAAQSTGYLPDGSELAEAIGAVRAGFETTAYVSQFELERDRLVLAGKLSDIKSISGEQLTETEQQLRTLDDILDTAQSQISTLKGIDNSVMSVEDAVQRLADAILGAKAVEVGKPGAGIGKPGGKVGEYMAQVTPDLLKGYTSSQISSADNWTFGSREAIVQAWQSGDYAAVADIVQRAGMSQSGLQNTFGLTGEELAHINSLGIRGVDPSQAVAGHDIVLGGGTATNTGQGALFDSLAQQAQAALAAGNEMGIYLEAKERGMSLADVDALLGLSAGSAGEWARNSGLPAFAAGGAHAGGLRVVGERGWEVEATGPARIWNQQQLGQALSGSGNTARLETLVERMTTALERVQALVSEGNRNTASLLEITDQKSEGGNADRVELMNVAELAKAIAKEIEKEPA